MTEPKESLCTCTPDSPFESAGPYKHTCTSCGGVFYLGQEEEWAVLDVEDELLDRG